MATTTRPRTTPVKPKPRAKKDTSATHVGDTADKPGLEIATVPDISFYDRYIQRNISPGISDFDVFDYGRTKKRNILIEGPTGPGKTSAVMAYAAREGLPFYAVPSNIGIEPSQLFGKFIPDSGGGFKWVDGPVTDIVRNGGVLLINEVNFMPDRVATVLFGLLDARRQITLLDHEAETIDASGVDLLIVADMNPDYEGTRPLNKAFRNRFGIKLWWDYDDKVEAKLIPCKALRAMAKQLRAEQQNGTYDTPTSTNMLMEFSDIYTDLGWDFAKSNFVNAYAGDERQPVAVVLDTHRKNIEDGFAALNPKTAPSKPDPEPAASGAHVGDTPDTDDGVIPTTKAELEALVVEEREQYVTRDDDGTWILMDPVEGIYGKQWIFS